MGVAAWVAAWLGGCVGACVRASLRARGCVAGWLRGCVHPDGEAYPIQGGCAHVAWPGPGPEGRARTHTRSCPGETGFALEQEFSRRHGCFLPEQEFFGRVDFFFLYDQESPSHFILFSEKS